MTAFGCIGLLLPDNSQVASPMSHHHHKLQVWACSAGYGTTIRLQARQGATWHWTGCSSSRPNMSCVPMGLVTHFNGLIVRFYFNQGIWAKDNGWTVRWLIGHWLRASQGRIVNSSKAKMIWCTKCIACNGNNQKNINKHEDWMTHWSKGPGQVWIVKSKWGLTLVKVDQKVNCWPKSTIGQKCQILYFLV